MRVFSWENTAFPLILLALFPMLLSNSMEFAWISLIFFICWAVSGSERKIKRIISDSKYFIELITIIKDSVIAKLGISSVKDMVL